MKSQRELSRKTLPFEMMVFLLILAFPRETAGATFFYQYDQNENHTLNCSQSGTEYVWYRGRDSSSLQEFEPFWRGANNTSPCTANSSDSNKTLGAPASSAGGIFACTPQTKNCTHPLFTNDSHCSRFDFFIVAVRNHAAEEKIFGTAPEQFESALPVPEKGNFTLTCEFQIKESSIEFALYWFKETTPSLCLLSAANEGESWSKASYDVNCCVDPAFRQRRTNRSDFHGQLLRHNLTIFNASASDSGMYLCVVAAWKNKRVWKVACNVSVEVKNSTPSPDYNTTRDGTSDGGTSSLFAKELPIPLGVIGGLVLICGITGLICWKKKAKGNPVEEHPRKLEEMEMEEEECSPYAVSSRNDIDKNETMYSVVTYAPEPQQGASTLLDGKPASRPGEELHTVYALVSK